MMTKSEKIIFYCIVIAISVVVAVLLNVLQYLIIK